MRGSVKPGDFARPLMSLPAIFPREIGGERGNATYLQVQL